MLKVNSTYKSTAEFDFAPEERDVYSYERLQNDLAPLGAKPGSGTTAEASKRNSAPTEVTGKKKIAGYKHLALTGRSHK